MFSSQARLARMCSLSERAVISLLRSAEQAGWIAPRKRELKGNAWAANEYVATWPDGVNDVHTNSPTLTSIEKKKQKKPKSVSDVLAYKPAQPADGVPISDILRDGLPPEDWITMAASMHRLSKADAWTQARKCVWYYSQGPGKDVRRRPDQWSKLYLKFFSPKMAA